MDLSRDILGLSAKVALVPGLSNMYALAFQIIAAVQACKDDTGAVLAHLIAERLIGIAEHMGTSYVLTENVNKQLNKLELILQNVSKSMLATLAKPGYQKVDIETLVQRIDEIYESIILLLVVNSSASDDKLHASAGSQQLLVDSASRPLKPSSESPHLVRGTTNTRSGIAHTHQALVPSGRASLIARAERTPDEDIPSGFINNPFQSNATRSQNPTQHDLQHSFTPRIYRYNSQYGFTEAPQLAPFGNDGRPLLVGAPEKALQKHAYASSGSFANWKLWLASQIFAIFQAFRNDDSDGFYLAHLVADRLLSIAEHMQKRAHDAPENLAKYLHELGIILSDVSDRVMAALTVNSGHQTTNAERIKQRVKDVHKLIISLLSANTSGMQELRESVQSQRITLFQSFIDSRCPLGLQPDIRTSANHIVQLPATSYHGWSVLDTQAEVPRIRHVVKRLERGSRFTRVDGNESDRTHTTEDVVLLSRFSFQLYKLQTKRSEATITFRQAEHGTDGGWVKAVLRLNPSTTDQAFVRDLANPGHSGRDLFFLREMKDSPLKAYFARSGLPQELGTWFLRTVVSNPPKTIYGIYDMQNSLRDLVGYQREEIILHDDSDFWFSLVDVRSREDEHVWTLVYAGDVFNSPHPRQKQIRNRDTPKTVQSRRDYRDRWTSEYQLMQRLLQSPFVYKVIGSHIEAPELAPESSVQLSGKIVRFDDQPIAFPISATTSSSSIHNTQIKSGLIPNLTRRIKIGKGPLCGGGFCDVYAGELTGAKGIEPVALKMLRLFSTEVHAAKAKKKFRREVNIWCSLQHPHVLPFYGTCEYDEFRLFMVSPWAKEGNSLDYLRRNPLADRGRLLWQTACALTYLHSGNDVPQIVHGDLKADNVLISDAGEALLCDFGLSRSVEEIFPQSAGSSAGRGGHPRFMAPELLGPSQTSGSTPESDVFAFASLMLQIFTEKPPFNNLREPQVIFIVATGGIPSRPIEPVVMERGLNDNIWNVMIDCWKFNPSERPTMEGVMRRIEPPCTP